MRQQTWHELINEFVCYWCFYWELFIVFRWTYIEHYGKNYQEDTDPTDALNTNLVQYRGEAGLLVSQISISRNVASTKWHHLGINAILLQQKPGFI